MTSANNWWLNFFLEMFKNISDQSNSTLSLASPSNSSWHCMIFSSEAFISRMLFPFLFSIDYHATDRKTWHNPIKLHVNILAWELCNWTVLRTDTILILYSKYSMALINQNVCIEYEIFWTVFSSRCNCTYHSRQCKENWLKIAAKGINLLIDRRYGDSHRRW